MGFRPRVPYSTVINRLGLSSGLKLCLDAGDASSYTGGQTWLDTSGNGYDFFRGAGSGAGADDPTFAGTPGGLSASEYWLCDSGDFFRYDSANETWMQNLHKDGAVYTILAWVYLTNLGAANSNVVCGTMANNGTNVGWQFQINFSDGKLRHQVGTGAALALNVTSGGTGVTINDWHLAGITISENAGASGGQFYLDGVANGAAFNPSYASPSAANATFTMEIAAAGNAQRPLGGNGDARIAALAIWEGVALTQAQINAFYVASNLLPVFHRTTRFFTRKY